jgi:hypothetical protein
LHKKQYHCNSSIKFVPRITKNAYYGKKLYICKKKRKEEANFFKLLSDSFVSYSQDWQQISMAKKEGGSMVEESRQLYRKGDLLSVYF